MTMITDRRSSVELVEAVELYQHLVRDHGWDENPYLLSQRLRELHRSEHVDDDSGVISLNHVHDGLAA
jgi:hypothetical protein